MQVNVTLNPRSAFPINMPTENFDTVCAALGIRELGRQMGRTRLDHTGEWHLTVGNDSFHMTVA